tara:strand:+ start:25 stop:678 length:654 start_codon:yes stop_codon:yes gene_type:complete
MVNYSNPFLTSFLGSRNQFTQPQNQFNQQQNQYDFSGWGDRLGKIEEGIAGLTDQFNNFQKPGDVAPEYTGNAAPEPLEQSTNAPEPLGGIESLPQAATGKDPMGWMNQPQPSRPVSPQSQHLMDGEWRQLTPEEFGTKFPNSPFNQNGTFNRSPTLNSLQPPGPKANPFQTFASPGGGKGAEQFQYQGRPNDLQQPIQQGVGLAGLYQQNNRGAGI